MPLTQWQPCAPAIAQVVLGTVTAVGSGARVSATINNKTLTYVCVSGDTKATAAAGLLALISSSDAPPEFQEITFTVSGDAVTATANTPGTPFAGISGGLVFSGSLGGAMTQTQQTANSSPSDAADPLNWLRAGTQRTRPQDNDDLVIADSSVPLLWNLDTAIPNVLLASYTRYQSFTASIGLPTNNPNGYPEWRATYFKMKGGGASGSSSSPTLGYGTVLNVILGYGGGSGPTRERYDFQSQQVNLRAQASGSPSDAYAIRILGTNTANVLSVVGTSVGVAMLPGEVASLASASVGAGGLVALGPLCTFGGQLTLANGLADVSCAVPTVLVQDSSQMVQGTVASALSLTYPSITLKNGCRLTWLSNARITSLNLQTQSVFDKSRSADPMTIDNLSIEVDSCTLLDTNGQSGTITFTQPVVLVNALKTGPFRFPAGKKFAITNQ